MINYFDDSALRRAHVELRGTFVSTGAHLPEDFDEAVKDTLWMSILRARAATNFHHARRHARYSDSHVAHGAQE